MSVSEILTLLRENWGEAALIICVLAKLIDVSPIKINPWKWAWSKLGQALNADVLAEIEKVKDEQAKAQQRMEEHIKADDERDMDGRRQRILRFNADIMGGTNFSHEYFCEILTEIDEYETYCKSHEDYKNSRAVMAIANIRRVCEEHEHNNDFLK